MDGVITPERPAAATLAGPATPLPGARTALVMLLAINLFNYIDRQVLAAVEPSIRRTFFADGHRDATFWTGLLATAFLLSYMVTAPLFGWLADRMSRWHLIGGGIILWSLASGASGWDWGGGPWAGFLALLAARCFVGIGEAAYGPVAPAVLADLYPVRRRGQIMAWFYLAMPVGGALGYTLGGQVDAWKGWRWAFYLVTPPGLVLGLLCFFLREPERGLADAAPRRKSGLGDYLGLIRIPSYVYNTLGMTAMCFAMGGLAFWMPEYLTHRKVPNLGPITPVTFFGALTALAGLIATLSGGYLGDRLRDRYPGSYFLVSGAAMIAGFPMVLLTLWTPFPWAWIWIFLAVFGLFFNTGPTNTILANVTHPSVRASAYALNIFVIHALGDAISPPVIGLLVHKGMTLGFAAVSAMMLVGGVFWLLGSRHLERDTRLAPTR